MIRRPMLMLLVLAACASPSAVAPPPVAVTAAYDEHSLCAEAPAESPICVDDVSDIDETTARVALGDQELVVRREGDRLTAFARVAAESASLCCSLQGEMARIAETDLFVARYRLARLDEAVLTFVPSTWLSNQREFRMEDQPRWIGPNAPPPPPVVTELRGQRFERTLWSEYLGETRRLYFYLPPGHDRTRTYPVVFMADGASVMVLAPMFERLIDDGKIAPVIFAGAASGREAIVEDRSSLGISDIRAADYLPGREERIPRFEQHLRFFSEELVDYASREFGGARDPAQRVVTGFSNGGSFSLFAALRRPDVFGISMPLSPSWRALPEEDLSRPLRARFLMSAGLYEIGRQRRASQYAETLRSRGFDVTMQTPAMGHDRDQEAAMLAQYLPMVFPPALR